jgi:rfaE bifunctional protein nucleotidyltransferase chain/domain
MVMPAPPTTAADPCGAGDRFAATAAALLADGALPSEAVAGAVAAASAFVATGAAASIQPPSSPPTPAAPEPQALFPGPPNREGSPAGEVAAAAVHTPPPIDRALRLIGAVRGRGGTVVATGGCFDLLHAGHVATLRAARALGDCLLVCLNSDDSVRRLKGPGRPLMRLADRIAVLEALGCVDVVVPFDERTPEAVLQRLRPDVFAKGGDYALADLPEAELLATWGGQAVVLPYLEGRSTTQLMKEVVRRDSH